MPHVAPPKNAFKIFISYRREDSEGDVRAVYNRLVGDFGQSRVFLDVEGIDGGEQSDGQLEGGPGRDKLTGGPNDDILRGGPGNDRLFGGRGNDQLFGGPGRDRLVGGPGRDLTKQ